MQDPNFGRAVVLISAHSEDEGALGVVLNRPTGQTLGQWEANFQGSPLADIPLYHGGPVAPEQLILTAWKWSSESGTFRLFFGIDDDRARSLLQEDPDYHIRGFFGHAGWESGQIEGELGQSAWLVAPIDPALDQLDGTPLWREITGKISPALRLLADAPDDPSSN